MNLVFRVVHDDKSLFNNSFLKKFIGSFKNRKNDYQGNNKIPVGAKRVFSSFSKENGM